MAKKKKTRRPASGDVATNRRARHKFELVETMEAGIELRGSEVKALREGKAQMSDAYAVVDEGEVWLRNLHIPPYAPASSENHEPERPAEAAAAPGRDRAPDRQDGAEGPDADPDADLLQGPAGEGRAGAGARQGGPRPAARDRRARRPPRGRARVQGADALSRRARSVPGPAADLSPAGDACKDSVKMRNRLAPPACVAALVTAAVLAPAAQAAGPAAGASAATVTLASFTDDARDFIDDNTAFIVGGLVAAILLLLIVMT